MDTNSIRNPIHSHTHTHRFVQACFGSCQKLVAQLQRARESILGESLAKHQGEEQLLRLAVGEAEALAWETGYPELVFPSLATEKVEHLAAWKSRQQRVLQESRTLAFAE